MSNAAASDRKVVGRQAERLGFEGGVPPRRVSGRCPEPGAGLEAQRGSRGKAPGQGDPGAARPTGWVWAKPTAPTGAMAGAGAH